MPTANTIERQKATCPPLNTAYACEIYITLLSNFPATRQLREWLLRQVWVERWIFRERSRPGLYHWSALHFINVLSYMLCMLTIKPLHPILLNLHRFGTLTGKERTKLDGPQRGLPPLSLPTSNFRPLQAVHRPRLQIFHLLLQCWFPSFKGGPVTITALLSAPTYCMKWHDGKMYDLECVEICECFARNDKF